MSQLNLVIWDEAPMSSRYTLNCVDRLLRECTQKPNVPFGGITVVLGGDFKQILPVLQGASDDQIIENTIKSSMSWAYFQHITLTKNMRVLPGQEDFAKWQQDLGSGKLQLRPDNPDYVMPRQGMFMPDENALLNWCFPYNVLTDPEEIAKRAFLTTVNSAALSLNENILDRIVGTARTYTAVDENMVTGFSGDYPEFPLEHLHRLTPSDLPPHRLRLKIGAIVTLQKNIDISRSFCNGTRMVGLQMNDHTIRCRQIGLTNNREINLTRVCMKHEDERALTAFQRT